MRKSKETVCAVVVTYNRKNYLLDCLESLRTQSLAPDAILIVDNASSDGTPEALKKAGISQMSPFQTQKRPGKLTEKFAPLKGKK